MFPDVDPLYVKNLLLRNIGPEAMNNVCNLLLENTNYPRAQKVPSSTAPSEAPSTKVGLTQHVQPTSLNIKEGGWRISTNDVILFLIFKLKLILCIHVYLLNCLTCLEKQQKLLRGLF